MSEPLFELIHSMTMQEKRHFKLFCSRYDKKGDSIHLRLFDAIQRQKSPDEKKLRSEFRHLAFNKHRLQKVILDSLRQYHAASTIDLEIKELLLDAEILFEKALFAHCGRLLFKAKKLCYRFERFVFIPEIVRLQSRLFDLGKLGDFYEEERMALAKMERISRYRSLSNRVALLVSGFHGIRDRKELARLEKVMRDPLLREENKADSFTAKIYYFYIKGVYAELKGRIQEGYRLRKRFCTLAAALPDQLRIHSRNYLAALNNLAISQLELQKFDEAKETVRSIRAFPRSIRSVPEDLSIDSFVFSSIIEMNIVIRTRDFKEGLAVLKPIEQQLKAREHKLQPQFRIVLWNSIKYICFGAGELKKALYWSNRILQDNDSSIRQDIRSMARIFDLILHFELGNRDLLEYRIPAAYRYLLKSQRLYKVESAVLRFLRKSTGISSPKELRVAFQELHKELLPLRKHPFEKKAFEEFDLAAWLEGWLRR